MTQRGAQMSPTEIKDVPKDTKWAAKDPKMEPEGAQKRISGTLENHEKTIAFIGFLTYRATRGPLRGDHNPTQDTKKTPKEHKVTTKRHWDFFLGTFGGILEPFWGILTHLGRF